MAEGAPSILADWQFWAATVGALAAALWLVRGPIRRGFRGRGAGARRTRVRLTIEGDAAPTGAERR